MALHFIFIAIYFIAGNYVSPEVMMMLSISQCCLGLLIRLSKNSTNFVNPYIVNLVALILVNMGNLSLLNRIETHTNLMYFFASAPDLPLAAMIWCVGNCFFFIGYLSFEKRSFPSIGLVFSKKNTKSIFYVLLFLALSSRSLQFLASFGALNKVLGLAGTVGVLFFARIWAADGDKKSRNYAIILYLIQTLQALLHSYLRLEILFPAVIFFVGYFTGMGSIKHLFSYRIIPFLLFFVAFLSIFPFLGKNRTNFGAAIVQEYFSSDDFADEEEMQDIYAEKIDRGGLLDRSSSLAQGSAVVKLVRTNGFYEGAASQLLLVAIVPRFLWPDKPKIALGQWFAIETGTAIYTEDGKGKANNSMNMTIPAELYIDFGWWEVILGCFLFGAFISALWNSVDFFISNYNLFGCIFGGYILFLGLIGLSGDLQIVITYISTYLAFLLIKRIICAYYV